MSGTVHSAISLGWRSDNLVIIQYLEVVFVVVVVLVVLVEVVLQSVICYVFILQPCVLVTSSPGRRVYL
jgi:hypothetical protein